MVVLADSEAIRRQVLYYLQSTFEFRNPAVASAFEEFLEHPDNGLFKGHPAKPYYEAMDGVGNLLYALLQLDQILKNPDAAVERKVIASNRNISQPFLNMENR